MGNRCGSNTRCYSPPGKKTVFFSTCRLTTKLWLHLQHLDGLLGKEGHLWEFFATKIFTFLKSFTWEYLQKTPRWLENKWVSNIWEQGQGLLKGIENLYCTLMISLMLLLLCHVFLLIVPAASQNDQWNVDVLEGPIASGAARCMLWCALKGGPCEPR